MIGGCTESLHNDTAMSDCIDRDVAEFAARNLLNFRLCCVGTAPDGPFNPAPLREFPPLCYRIYADDAASVNLKHL